jgi:LPXTG-motif cell wall-anchored protein
MDKNYSDLDGSVELYDAVLADNPVTKNYYDADNFYPADGEEFSNFLPLLATQTRAGQRLFKGTFLDKKERARRRAVREKRKDMEAQTSKTAAEALGKESQSDILLAKSLNAPPSFVKKTGMSTTTKVFIGVGILAVLGIGGYFLYKKFGKGK